MSYYTERGKQSLGALVDPSGWLKDQQTAHMEAIRLSCTNIGPGQVCDHRVNRNLPKHVQKMAATEALNIVRKRQATAADKAANRAAEAALLAQQQALVEEEASSTRNLLYIGGAVAVAAVLIVVLKKKKGPTTP